MRRAGADGGRAARSRRAGDGAAVSDWSAVQEVNVDRTRAAQAGYTQRDVFEVARCLTGWRLRTKFRIAPCSNGNISLMVDLARLPYADSKAKKEMSEKYRIPVGELKKALPPLLHRVEELHEFNPMLGFRGCRLGIALPEVTEMQARAIIEAAVLVEKEGVKTHAEIMIPLTSMMTEMENQSAICRRVAEEVFAEKEFRVHYLVGTMIERFTRWRSIRSTARTGSNLGSSSAVPRAPPWDAPVQSAVGWLASHVEALGGDVEGATRGD